MLLYPNKQVDATTFAAAKLTYACLLKARLAASNVKHRSQLAVRGLRIVRPPRCSVKFTVAVCGRFRGRSLLTMIASYADLTGDGMHARLTRSSKHERAQPRDERCSGQYDPCRQRVLVSRPL